MTENWLQHYLSSAVERRLCTSIHCTTCGALPFRKGLQETLDKVTQGKNNELLGRAGFEALVQALAGVTASPRHGDAFEEAVRFVLQDLWYRFAVFQGEVQEQLAGTWAGSVLDDMQAHHAAVTRAQREREEYDDPVNVQKRREEKKRLKQEQLRQRLEDKKERDRIWWETHERPE